MQGQYFAILRFFERTALIASPFQSFIVFMSQDDAASQEVADAYIQAEDLHAELGLPADGHVFDPEAEIDADVVDLSKILEEFDLDPVPNRPVIAEPAMSAAVASGAAAAAKPKGAHAPPPAARKRSTPAAAAAAASSVRGRPFKTAADKFRECIRESLSHDVRMVCLL